MKTYLSMLLLTLFTSISAYSQKLMINIDLRGNFKTQIIINGSSITLNDYGDIINVKIKNNKKGKNSSFDNLNSGRLLRIGGLEIKYDFHTDKISKIGNMEIDYDFHTKKISKIGNSEFDYDFHTKRISKIGDVRIDYDFHSDKISEIGDVKFDYDFRTERLKTIGNKEFKYEFNDRGVSPKKRIKFTSSGILFSVKVQ